MDANLGVELDPTTFEEVSNVPLGYYKKRLLVYCKLKIYEIDD